MLEGNELRDEEARKKEKSPKTDKKCLKSNARLRSELLVASRMGGAEI
jgi:hypothetical protein